MARVKFQDLVVAADGLFLAAQAVEAAAFDAPGSYKSRVKFQIGRASCRERVSFGV